MVLWFVVGFSLVTHVHTYTHTHTHTHTQIVIYRDCIRFFLSTLMRGGIATGTHYRIYFSSARENVGQIFAGNRYRESFYGPRNDTRKHGSAELIFFLDHFANMLDFLLFSLVKVSFVLTFNVDTGAHVFNSFLPFHFERETTRRCFRFQKKKKKKKEKKICDTRVCEITLLCLSEITLSQYTHQVL